MSTGGIGLNDFRLSPKLFLSKEECLGTMLPYTAVVTGTGQVREREFPTHNFISCVRVRKVKREGMYFLSRVKIRRLDRKSVV